MKKIYKLEDLDCANCAAKMETAINKIDDIYQNDLFYKWISSIPKKKLPDNMIIFTEEIFNVMKQKKEQTDKYGPKVSLEYEQELIQKYGNKNKSR